MTSTTAPETLRARLRGGASDARGALLIGPRLTDLADRVPSDPEAADPGQSVAVALRRRADAIVALQREVAETGADLLVAPTACTTAPALHATGQAYRAAALTAAAVDLTRDAALAARSERRAAAIGEVTASADERARAEAVTHVERLATSAVDAILVLADDLDASGDAVGDVVRAAHAHGLPALVEIDASRAEALATDLALEAAALPDSMLIRAVDPDAAVTAVGRVRASRPGLAVGVRLVAAEHDPQSSLLSSWSKLAPLDLALLGAGGARAIEALAALADLSRATRPSVS